MSPTPSAPAHALQSPREWRGAIPMGIQQVTLLLGIVVTVVFGVRTI
jgi:hypothetical protein